MRGNAPCHLSTVANWADKVRLFKRWSAPLHYINGNGDHPPDDCRFPGDDGWEGKERANVLDAITNTSTVLTDFAQGSTTATAGPESAQEALKFLIHFVGDMHQPLHLCGRAKGGNDIKVHWHNHVMKFHAVWDNALIAKAIGSTPDNYSHPIAVPALESVLLGKDYDPYIRRIVWEGLGSGRHAGQWGSEKDKWMSCPRPLSDSAVNAEWSLQEVLAAPRKPKPPARGGPPKSSDSDVLCPYAWGKPIHKLNCDLIWTPDLHESETENRRESSS